MYVCLCHGVTDRAIRQAVREGVSDFAELQAVTAVATCCGGCREYAEDTFDFALSAEVGNRLVSAAKQWVPML